MEAMYNGSKLAETANAVVVAINYRLSVFGFMPVQFADGTITSNIGFGDQRLAMQWVADHIGSFGGMLAAREMLLLTIVGQETRTG